MRPKREACGGRSRRASSRASPTPPGRRVWQAARTRRAASLLSLVFVVGCTCGGGPNERDGGTGGGTATGGGGGELGGGAGGGIGTDGGMLPDGGCTMDCGIGVCVAGSCCSSTSQVCGSECCTTDAVCLFGQCVTPGRACHTGNDCSTGEYCETALGGDGGFSDAGAPGDGGTCTQPLPLGGRCVGLLRCAPTAETM